MPLAFESTRDVDLDRLLIRVLDPSARPMRDPQWVGFGKARLSVVQFGEHTKDLATR